MIYAILAAIVWGVNYSIDEKLVGKLPTTLIVFYQSLIAVIIILIYFFIKKDFSFGFETLSKDKELLFYLISSILLCTIGSLLIITSIKESNATVAGLIEISYPIFIVLASYFLFKTNHLNPYLAIGGILIFSGVLLIYLKG